MPKMRAVQVPRPGGPLEIVERDIPDPGPGYVRIKVQACGVCHSDSVTKDGLFPGIQYPRVPGHEVVGLIDAVGAGVPRWKAGQRVGVGWNGGFCGLLRQLPARRFLRLPDFHRSHRPHPRRRLCRLHAGPHQRAGVGARRSVIRRRGAADVRRRYHLQLSSQ